MYELLLGIAGLVLMERLARWEDENPTLWMGLVVAVILLSFLLPLGGLGVFGGIVLILAAFFVKRVLRKEQGRGPVR